MADVVIKIDDAKLRKLAFGSDGTKSLVESATSQVTSNANAMGAGFRTGLYHRDHKSPAVGNTQPVYKGDVRKFGRKYVGIVVTGNYAAMKDNHLHNTLLKSL